MNNVRFASFENNLASVRQALAMNQQQVDHLYRTIENSSRLNRFQLLSSRLIDVLKRMFFPRAERSERQIAKDNLSKFAVTLIKKHSICQTDPRITLGLVKKADRLGSFIFKFLVSSYSRSSLLALPNKFCNSSLLKAIFNFDKSPDYLLSEGALDRIILTGAYEDPSQTHQASLAKIEKVLKKLNEGLKSYTSHEDCKVYKAYQIEKQTSEKEKHVLGLKKAFLCYQTMKSKFHPLKLTKID